MNFFKLQYWFSVRPEPMQLIFLKGLLFVVIIFLAALIFFKVMEKRDRRGIYNKIWRRLSSFFSVNAIILAFLLFFTYEGVPFLSGRFWFLFWLIEMLAWFAFIAKDIRKLPEEKKKFFEKQEYHKYIPERNLK